MTDVMGKWEFPGEIGDTLRVERVGVGKWNIETDLEMGFGGQNI